MTISLKDLKGDRRAEYVRAYNCMWHWLSSKHPYLLSFAAQSEDEEAATFALLLLRMYLDQYPDEEWDRPLQDAAFDYLTSMEEA